MSRRLCTASGLLMGIVVLTGCFAETSSDGNGAAAGDAEAASGGRDPSGPGAVVGVWALTSFGSAARLGEGAGPIAAALAGLPDDRPVTMDLTQSGRVAGHAGCNNYFGEFRLSNGHRVSTGSLGSTRMACEKERMKLERAFLETLDAATRVYVSGDAMELHSEDGLVLAFRRVGVAE